MKITAAVLPIAGLGTRFLPLSKVIPKEFFPLNSKPVIQYIVEEALEAGVKKIIFVVSPDKEKFLNKYFKEDKELLKLLKERKKNSAIETLKSIPKIKYEYVIQKEPYGDGDAILKAEKLVGKKPFLVLFGDDISFNENGPLMAEQLVKTFEEIKKPLLCLYKKPKKELFAYGVPKVTTKLSLLPSSSLQLPSSSLRGRSPKQSLCQIEDIVEKPEKNPPSSFALVGKYILTPEIFYYLKKEPLHNGEIGLAYALQDMIKDGKDVFGIEAEGKWLECGTKEKWFQAFLYLTKRPKKTIH